MAGAAVMAFNQFTALEDQDIPSEVFEPWDDWEKEFEPPPAKTQRKEHRCDTCGNTFARLDSVKTHQLIYSGEKPHPDAHAARNGLLTNQILIDTSRHTRSGKKTVVRVAKHFTTAHPLTLMFAPHTKNNKQTTINPALEQPSLVSNREDLERTIQEISSIDFLEWVRQQRPNSKWVVDLVTNVTWFVWKIRDHPIGRGLTCQATL